MNLDFWGRTFYSSWVELPMEAVYSPKPNSKAVLVVETQDEYDYLSAMQLIMGNTIDIALHDGDRLANLLTVYDYIYTTFNPVDRNRL